jgi:hypothetical protein
MGSRVPRNNQVSLIDVLRLLPVQPYKERDVLGRARYEALQAGRGEVHGVPVAAGDLNQLFLDSAPGGPKVSQQGARLLLRLLREDVLDVVEERQQEACIELLEAYAEGRASILGTTFWARPRGRRRPASTPREAILQAPEPELLTQPYRPTYRVTVHRLL